MAGAGPFQKAWRAWRQHPSLWALPLVLDLARWGLARVAEALGAAWVRWDFYLGYSPGGGVRLLLPTAVPSAEQLGASFGAQPPPQPDWSWYAAMAVPVALAALAESLVRAGYLALAHGALHGVPPAPAVWWRGVRRYGPTQVALTLLWMGLAAWLGTWPEPLATAGATLAGFAFYMAQFVVLTDGAGALRAVLGAPLLAWVQLPALTPPALAAAAASGALTAALAAAGLLVPAPAPGAVPAGAGTLPPWAPAPAVALWAPVGALTGLWWLAALEQDISTRREPGMPWACRRCGVQNPLEAATCAACGAPDAAGPGPQGYAAW